MNKLELSTRKTLINIMSAIKDDFYGSNHDLNIALTDTGFIFVDTIGQPTVVIFTNDRFTFYDLEGCMTDDINMANMTVQDFIESLSDDDWDSHEEIDPDSFKPLFKSDIVD